MAADIHVLSDEERSVRSWRFEQLTETGPDGLRLDYERATEATADLSFEIEKYRNLREQGCDPITAYDIVR